MGAKFPKPRKTSISIPMQKCHLLTKYGKLLIKDNSSRKIDMDFLIKSTNTNIEYTIKIKQNSICEVPKVFLLNDNLHIYEETIPHIYGTRKIKGKEYLILCPFHPKTDWDNKLIIANTVFLWAIEWIYFYEIWVVSGQWCGRWNTSRRRKRKKQNLIV